jgi:hypothetical protein
MILSKLVTFVCVRVEKKCLWILCVKIYAQKMRPHIVCIIIWVFV